MKAKRILAVSIAVLLVFVMLFSHLFVILEAGHECSGEDCAICVTLHAAEDLLQKLSLLISLASVALLLQVDFAALRVSFCQSRSHVTPVLLKVKLSN